MQYVDGIARLVRPTFVVFTLALSACGSGPPAPPPTGVNVATVVQRSITEWDEFSGRIEAIESIDLRPRVSGYLTGVHFHEGGDVRKGDLLFTIDDREYRASADNARANWARTATRVEVARTELARTEKLANIHAASIEELEQRRGELKQALADQNAAAAQLRQARLPVSFTRITAPIDGRIGRALVRPGNLVVAGVTVLSTLVSIDPVYVAFEGDERIYLKYQELAKAGTRPSSRDARNPVRVGLASEPGFPHRGEMAFVDNHLDPSTGTIHARALLPNKDHVFTPGLFARIQLIGDTVKDALLIHDKAVLTDQDRKYVYVLGPGNRALRKDVVLGVQVEGLRVVRGGLVAGDRVIVNGTRKIFANGQPLDPYEVPMNNPEQQPPAPPSGK